MPLKNEDDENVLTCHEQSTANDERIGGVTGSTAQSWLGPCLELASRSPPYGRATLFHLFTILFFLVCRGIFRLRIRIPADNHPHMLTHNDINNALCHRGAFAASLRPVYTSS